MARLQEILAPAFLADRIARTVLDLLFPPLCMSCRRRVSEPHALCAACWATISFIEGAVCAKCGTPFEADPGSETICGYVTRNHIISTVPVPCSNMTMLRKVLS